MKKLFISAAAFLCAALVCAGAEAATPKVYFTKDISSQCTAKLILYTKGVKVRQDIIVFST